MVKFPHCDTLVISAGIVEVEVRRVLVDGGSSADLLFKHAFNQLCIPRSWLSLAHRPLQGFNRAPLNALGQIELPVVFGEGSVARTEVITFDVVNVPYAYNAILG